MHDIIYTCFGSREIKRDVIIIVISERGGQAFIYTYISMNRISRADSCKLYHRNFVMYKLYLSIYLSTVIAISKRCDVMLCYASSNYIVSKLETSCSCIGVVRCVTEAATAGNLPEVVALIMCHFHFVESITPQLPAKIEVG